MSPDWNALHPHKGSRSTGFEELCVQLARTESPSDARFVRAGAPDAGVECYCVLPDESEWGWQAKYFLELGPSQWSQIDRSVKTALDKHPKLVRYFVCIPINRSDSRIAGQLSAMDRWHRRVEKWAGWARAKDMNVDFVWWGDSELLHFLSGRAHRGLRSFWFGELHFDDDWFRSHLDRAVEAAGSRYTPEIHIDSPTTREFDLFGRTDSAFDSIKSRARDIRHALSWVRTGVRNSSPDASLENLVQQCEDILVAFSAIQPTPSGDCPFADIAEKIEMALAAADKSIVLQNQRARELDTKTQGDKKSSEYRQNIFKEISSSLRSLRATLRDTYSQVCNANEKCNGHLLVLTGEAGCGKTHLLCDLARNRLSADAPTVLLLGQQFLSSEDPWTQALRHLDIRANGVDEFVGALDAAAQAANCRVLVIVDALNEGKGRDIWLDHLASFLEPLKKCKWIGIVLAVRKNYQDLLIPGNLQKDAISVEHLGFAGQEYEAAEAFFSHYDIKFPSVPILNPEFQRPLFLKTLCEGLNGLGKHELPTGFQGITEIFDLYLQAVNSRLSKRLDYDPSDNLVRKALERLAEYWLDTDTGSRWIAPEDTRDAVNALLPDRTFSASLYQGLISEGVLIKDLIGPSGDIDDEAVYIVYERFADHIAADLILRTHVDLERPADAFAAGGELYWVRENWASLEPGLIEALCIQVPEYTKRELFDLLPQFHEDDCLDFAAREAFRQSIIWRNTDAFTETTREILNECICDHSEWDDSLGILLMVSTIVEHPFNASFLDKYLARLSMPERDQCWSVYLHHSWRNQSPVDRLVGWAARVSVKDAVDPRTMDLCAVVLAWMFTASNRFLRDRATKALVSLLTGRLDATERLVERFARADDPYVAERVYAVAYGVAMRCGDAESVGRLAAAVYDSVFAPGSPPPHILLRDYARGVIERAIALGVNGSLDERVFRPPYSSVWPAIPDAGEIEELVAGRSQIAFSVMHGDFGLYVIGTNSGVSDWLSLCLDEEPWEPELDSYYERPCLDLSIIQRYVIWRAFDLGWTDERFGLFDSFIARRNDNRQEAKVERIGKKYQWIAYHEILGHISDRYQLCEAYGYDHSQIYRGPWQCGTRDIDPSCLIVSASYHRSDAWWASVSNIQWRHGLDYGSWLSRTDDFPNIGDLLNASWPGDSARWLNVDGFFRWSQPIPPEFDRYDIARRQMWLRCTGQLVRSEEVDAFLRWSKGVEFYGRWMPQSSRLPPLFLGEYGWAPAYQDAVREIRGWHKAGQECPVATRSFANEYYAESGFDCSIDQGYSFKLPHYQFLASLGLAWSGRGADYVDESGAVVALDPTAHEDGPAALLVREDMLLEYLSKEKLELFWIVIGEKQLIGGDVGRGFPGLLRVSGLYRYTEGGPQGSLNCTVMEPSG